MTTVDEGIVFWAGASLTRREYTIKFSISLEPKHKESNGFLEYNLIFTNSTTNTTVHYFFVSSPRPFT